MKKEELISLLNDPEITDDWSDSNLIEYVTCLKEVHSELYDDYRWWNIWESVYETKNGNFIAYKYAISTGDNTPSELGYEGNGLDDLAQVHRKQITTYIYE